LKGKCLDETVVLMTNLRANLSILACISMSACGRIETEPAGSRGSGSGGSSEEGGTPDGQPARWCSGYLRPRTPNDCPEGEWICESEHCEGGVCVERTCACPSAAIGCPRSLDACSCAERGGQAIVGFVEGEGNARWLGISALF